MHGPWPQNLYFCIWRENISVISSCVFFTCQSQGFYLMFPVGIWKLLLKCSEHPRASQSCSAIWALASPWCCRAAIGSQTRPSQSQANGPLRIMVAPWSCHGSPGTVFREGADTPETPEAMLLYMSMDLTTSAYTTLNVTGDERHEKFPGLLRRIWKESEELSVRRGSSLKYLDRMRKVRTTSPPRACWNLGSSIPGSCLALPMELYLLICEPAHSDLRLWAQDSTQSLWERFRPLLQAFGYPGGPVPQGEDSWGWQPMPPPTLHMLLPTSLCKEYFSNACARQDSRF